jgi:hypothetical protein
LPPPRRPERFRAPPRPSIRTARYLHSIKRYQPVASQSATACRHGDLFTRRSGDLSSRHRNFSSFHAAALSTVRRGAYPAFPDDVWPGKTQRRFTVELDFVPK